MIQPISTVNSTKRTNPTISGQNMGGNLIAGAGAAATSRDGGYAWSATCSAGEGNFQATCRRRS